MFQLEQEKGLKAESVEPTPKNPLKPWRQQSLRLQKQKPLLIAGASNMSQLYYIKCKRVYWSYPPTQDASHT